MENIFKQASQAKLRVLTEKGPFTVEQLWDLPMTVLARTIQRVHSELEETKQVSDELSFLNETIQTKPDSALQLTFDILKTIYEDKKQAAATIKNAAAVKEHNQKILALIASKEEEAVSNLSIDELKKMLK